MSVTVDELNTLLHRRRGGLNRRWLVVPLLALVLAPLAMLAVSWWSPQPATWTHLGEYVLPRLLFNTGLQIMVVGAATLVLGTGFAWLAACCEYPGRRWLEPLLVLPLAFPTYVLAFVYLGILDYGGPVQETSRALFGGVPGWVTALRGPGGVLAVLVLAFYPYVYLLARSSFIAGGLSTFEAGRSLGVSPLRVFLQVNLPAARPAIVAGMALVLMETLADFGAVAIYGYDTFTTAIYRTWYGLFNLTAAAQLASLLMILMVLLLGLERLSRGRFRPRQDKRYRPHRIRLSGWRAAAAVAVQLAVIALGVLVPVVQLAVWAAPRMSEMFNGTLMRNIANTVALSLGGATLVLGAGLLLALGLGRRGRERGHWLSDVAGLGYAIPGTVLAVAVMLAFTGIDRWLDTALAGGMLALLLAYLVRFLRVAYGPLESGFARLRPEYTEAAESLGASGFRTWWSVTLPLLRPGLVTGFLLVLVEIAKEMPATLMMRPFGWETLAVGIYQFTAEGHWERAAVPALLLVVLGAVPVILLMRRTTRSTGRSPVVKV